jgi:protease-4
MTMTAEEIIDRRRLRRKLTFWRVLAFVVVVGALVGGALYVGRKEGITTAGRGQVARVTISGFISDNRRQLEMLERIRKDSSVKAVILAINSTGGTTAGGEALYNAVRKLDADKPVVATLGTVAASAAYMTAIGAERIVSRRTSITGSIGVIFEYPEVSELMAKLGVKMEELKSAPLKAEPSPFRPASDEAKAAMQTLIVDTYRWFVGIVAERRGLTPAEADAVSDGRVFTGNQALAAKLVDEIGGEEEARAWLASTRSVPADLPIRDWRPQESGGFLGLPNLAISWVAEQLGVPPALVHLLGLERFLPEPGKLDGLLSVWQGSLDRRSSEGAPQ